MISKEELHFSAKVRNFVPDFNRPGDSYIEVDIEICDFKAVSLVSYKSINQTLSRGTTSGHLEEFLEETRKRVELLYDFVKRLDELGSTKIQVLKVLKENRDEKDEN